MNFCGSTQILHRKQNNENNIIYPNTFYIGGERMRKIRESAAKEQFLGTIILNNPHMKLGDMSVRSQMKGNLRTPSCAFDVLRVK